MKIALAALLALAPVPSLASPVPNHSHHNDVDEELHHQDVQ